MYGPRSTQQTQHSAAPDVGERVAAEDLARQLQHRLAKGKEVEEDDEEVAHAKANHIDNGQPKDGAEHERHGVDDHKLRSRDEAEDCKRRVARLLFVRTPHDGLGDWGGRGGGG